jgi:hypothetical protein
MKYTKYIQIITLVVVVVLPALVHAQPNFTDDVVDAPIDGGLSLLIAGGVGYAAKKIRDRKKQEDIASK